MPQNVRNFWLELEVDGRKSKIATGPIKGDGGFCLTICIRDKGQISDKQCLVLGEAHEDGVLTVQAYDQKGGCPHILLEGKR